MRLRGLNDCKGRKDVLDATDLYLPLPHIFEVFKIQNWKEGARKKSRPIEIVFQRLLLF